MSTLVAYDSSSDDEQSESPKTVQSKSTISTIVDETIPKSRVEVKPIEGPMVGPSIPTEGMHSYQGYEDGYLADAALSERDTVRYLTQASYPMTEIPPSPPGSPNPSSSAKFRHFLELKAKGVHFNEDLAKKSAFRNPVLLQTLMDRFGFDPESAYHTSLPLAVFDPACFPTAAYKEGLLKNQQDMRSQDEAEKKVLAAAGKRSVEFTSGGATLPSGTQSPGGIRDRQKL